MSSDEQSDNRDAPDSPEPGAPEDLAGEGASADAESETEIDGDEGAAAKSMLGVERWVQLTFVAAALLFVWLFDHLIASAWYAFADPDESLVTFGAIACGVLATIAVYRQPVIYSTVHDTVEELSKVSWPTRTETSSSTVIVVVTSVVAALMLFLFDSVWSAVTDLVYKV